MQANILIKNPIVGNVGRRTITLENIKEIIICKGMASIWVAVDGNLEEIIYPTDKIVSISE